MVRDVELEIEAGQVAPFLVLDLVDLELGEHYAAFRLVGVG